MVTNYRSHLNGFSIKQWPPPPNFIEAQYGYMLVSRLSHQPSYDDDSKCILMMMAVGGVNLEHANLHDAYENNVW